jgi:hypothetical protein
MLAPPERDAWFCMSWDWAMEAFHAALRKQGFDYKLRQERLAFCCYRAYFGYLTEYMSACFELGAAALPPEALREGYFENWIKSSMEFADQI